jgi:hypothetical protein
MTLLKTLSYCWGRSYFACSCFVPLHFWSDAFSTASFLINNPSRTIDMKKTFERLRNETPDYTLFKVFSCACWPHLWSYTNHKLDFHLKKCIFLGYNSLHKGYTCIYVSSNRVYISRDVIIDENSFPLSTCLILICHHQSHNHLYFLLTNLWILHMPCHYLIIMVQERIELLVWRSLRLNQHLLELTSTIRVPLYVIVSGCMPGSPAPSSYGLDPEPPDPSMPQETSPSSPPPSGPPSPCSCGPSAIAICCWLTCRCIS